MTMQEATFYIHNTTRDVKTRPLRRLLHGPESSTKNIFISGVLRVVRGRPMPVKAGFIRTHRAELADKEAKGLIAVYTSNSQRVNLDTLEVLANSSPPPEPEAEDVVAEDTPILVDAPVAEEAPAPVDAPVPSEEVQTSVEVPFSHAEAPTEEQEVAYSSSRRRRNR
jgi:hypothetical protein